MPEKQKLKCPKCSKETSLYIEGLETWKCKFCGVINKEVTK